MLFLFVYVYIMGELALHNAASSNMYIELQRQLPGQLMYFISGTALFYYYKQFTLYSK